MMKEKGKEKLKSTTKLLLPFPILAFNDFLGAISRCIERLQKVEEEEAKIERRYD